MLHLLQALKLLDLTIEALRPQIKKTIQALSDTKPKGQTSTQQATDVYALVIEVLSAGLPKSAREISARKWALKGRQKEIEKIALQLVQDGKAEVVRQGKARRYRLV